eukprot:GHVS01108287.1.p1 GENE.GHVS01108287.1~~GHVS01108287.1.p1  ORF type:complete len:135 (+),score=2.23 GHVS01108287.1:280-684(+)
MNLSLPIMLALVAFVLTVVPADSTGSQDSTESQDSTGSQNLKELREQKLKCQKDIWEQYELLKAAKDNRNNFVKLAQEDKKQAELNVQLSKLHKRLVEACVLEVQACVLEVQVYLASSKFQHAPTFRYTVTVML